MIEDGIRGILLYELKRDLRKKGIVLILVFTALPVIAAIAMKALGVAVEEERLWAVMMGFDIGAGAASGLVAGLGIAGWAWLVAVVYGGDLLASDLREGGYRLIAVRPVGRRGYAAGKMIALAAFLVVAFTAAGAAVAVAATLVGGPQSKAWMAPLLGALIGLGSLQIALLASAFGALTRNPMTGFILGAAVTLLTGAAVGLALGVVVLRDPFSVESWRRYYELTILASGAIPILAGPTLPSIIYYLVEFDNTFIPLPLPLVDDPETAASLVELSITPAEVLPLYAASTIAGTLVLAYMNYRIALRVEA